MPEQLPFLTFKHDELPEWETRYESHLGVHIIKDKKTGKPVLAVHADDTATLVMALPKLLKFMLAFGLNHPCRIPVDQVLTASNIKLVRKGEENVKPKSEPMAD